MEPIPVALTTCPPWRANASRIASGCSSHRRVEPSMSVNKNVTVPDGNSATTTPGSPDPDTQGNQAFGTSVTCPRAAAKLNRRPGVADQVTRGRIIGGMALQLHSDPELAAVVARARRRAQEAGELHPAGNPPFESVLDPAAREIVVSWIRDGGYDRAVAEVVADEPDLATQ